MACLADLIKKKLLLLTATSDTLHVKVETAQLLVLITT